MPFSKLWIFNNSENEFLCISLTALTSLWRKWVKGWFLQKQKSIKILCRFQGKVAAWLLFTIFPLQFFPPRLELCSLLWEFIPGVWGYWPECTGKYYCEVPHLWGPRNCVLCRPRSHRWWFLLREALHLGWKLAGKNTVSVHCYLFIQTQNFKFSCWLNNKQRLVSLSDSCLFQYSFQCGHENVTHISVLTRVDDNKVHLVNVRYGLYVTCYCREWSKWKEY